jgi:hypothetical protein
MVDTLAALLETIINVGPGQYMLLQFIIAPEEESWYWTGRAEVDRLVGRAKPAEPGALERILQRFADLLYKLVTFGAGGEEEPKKEERKQEQPIEFNLTFGQRDALKILEENLGKIQFRTKMRYVYVGRSETFSKPTGVSSVIGAIKQFNDQNLNSVKPSNSTKTDAQYLFVNTRLRYLQRRILNRFRWRDPAPYGNNLRMSTAELATVFHIPDMAIVAPSLTRVAAKRGGAPTNLPIE